MGLADLKNTCALRAKPKSVSVDEFINGAELYAKGISTSNVVSIHHKSTAQQSDFKPCTFTLTTMCRNELQQYADELGISKSKLIRILTHNLCSMGELERQLIVKLYNYE